MSELCLLAASLIAQGQASGWHLAMASKLPALLPDGINAGLAQWCPSQPEGLGAKALVSRAEIDRPLPEFSRTAPGIPPVVQASPPPTLTPTGYQEVSATAAAAPVPSTPSQAAVLSLHSSTPLVIPDRPITGSQLYQQRLAALKAGATYTRLPTDSFRDQWMNAIEQPAYADWVNLLHQEGKAMAYGQGQGRLTVLVGDSLSLWFPSEMMSSDRFWLNQGISGDTTTSVLQRLSAFAKTRPDTIYVMAGINDLRQGATDAEVIHNLRLIMRQLKQAHPQSKVIVHSILPTRLAALPTDRIRRLNYAIANATQEEGVFFLNLQPSFMDNSGILRRDLTTDGLHLSVQGYRTWGSVIASIL